MPKMSSFRVSLAVAAGLAAAASPSQAQSATATISWVAAGSSYNYTITLTNTGSLALNSLWYGWTKGGDNLPSTPSSPANSVGWGNEVSGNSIKWVDESYSYYGYTYYDGTPLAPGASTTFTFVSSSPPSSITASPSGKSVAYVGAIDSSEGTDGDSTAAFSPTLLSPPPQVLAVSLNPTGSGATASNSLILAWPTNIAGLTLQSTTNLFGPTAWATVSNTSAIIHGQYTVTNIISGAQQFYRLVN